MCQMCIKTGWVQLYNDLVCPEKINYIDNKMFGIGQNNEVNEQQSAVYGRSLLARVILPPDP